MLLRLFSIGLASPSTRVATFGAAFATPVPALQDVPKHAGLLERPKGGPAAPGLLGEEGRAGKTPDIGLPDAEQVGGFPGRHAPERLDLAGVAEDLRGELFAA